MIIWGMSRTDNDLVTGGPIPGQGLSLHQCVEAPIHESAWKKGACAVSRTMMTVIKLRREAGLRLPQK